MQSNDKPTEASAVELDETDLAEVQGGFFKFGKFFRFGKSEPTSLPLAEAPRTVDTPPIAVTPPSFKW